MRESLATRVLIVTALGAVLLMLLGHLAGRLGVDAVDAETRRYVEQAAGEEIGQGELAGGIGYWATPRELDKAELPDHFASGPGRPEARIEWLFRPRFVLRPARSVARPGSGGRKGWAYVVTRPGLPFFVRSHFGYFPGQVSGPDASGTREVARIEGVRTYFSLFGKRFLLNEWAVRADDAPR